MRSGSDDQFTRARNGDAGVFGEFPCYALARILAAAILRISLLAAQTDAVNEGIQRAWNRRECIDVTMREINVAAP